MDGRRAEQSVPPRQTAALLVELDPLETELDPPDTAVDLPFTEADLPDTEIDPPESLPAERSVSFRTPSLAAMARSLNATLAAFARSEEVDLRSPSPLPTITSHAAASDVLSPFPISTMTSRGVEVLEPLSPPLVPTLTSRDAASSEAERMMAVDVGASTVQSTSPRGNSSAHVSPEHAVVEDTDDPDSMCVVCQESLLSSPACALSCGHVYHTQCFQQWLLKNRKGDCIQCRAPAPLDKMRTLDFEVIELPPRALDEVKRLMALAPEERVLLTDGVRSGSVALASELQQMESQASKEEEDSQERKRKFAQVEEADKELTKAWTRLKRKSDSAVGNGEKLRAEISRFQRRVPQADDAVADGRDLQEERNLLRAGLSPADRARQLHESLLEIRRRAAKSTHEQRVRMAALRRSQEKVEALRVEERDLRARLGPVPSPREPVKPLPTSVVMNSPRDGIAGTSHSVPSTVEEQDLRAGRGLVLSPQEPVKPLPTPVAINSPRDGIAGTSHGALPTAAASESGRAGNTRGTARTPVKPLPTSVAIKSHRDGIAGTSHDAPSTAAASFPDDDDDPYGAINPGGRPGARGVTRVARPFGARGATAPSRPCPSRTA